MIGLSCYREPTKRRKPASKALPLMIIRRVVAKLRKHLKACRQKLFLHEVSPQLAHSKATGHQSSESC